MPPAPSSGRRRGPTGRRRDPARALSGPVREVLARLPEMERRLLELRTGLADGHPHGQADAARALGLDQAEAREIERRAFDRLREVVPLDDLAQLLRG